MQSLFFCDIINNKQVQFPMTYRDLLERLQKLNDNQLDKTAILWNIEDSDFTEIDYNSEGNIEIAKASDLLNDEDATYFII